jgi:hypothetical protein
MRRKFSTCNFLPVVVSGKSPIYITHKKSSNKLTCKNVQLIIYNLMAYSPLFFVVSFVVPNDQRKNAIRARDTARPHRYRSYHLPDRKLAMRYHLSRQSEPVFFKRLWSPGIDSKE